MKRWEMILKIPQMGEKVYSGLLGLIKMSLGMMKQSLISGV